VAIGKFASLETELGADQSAVLVDLRNDMIEGQPRQGLVLHHPQLAMARLRRLEQGDASPLRIDEERVQQLLELNQLRLRNAASANASIQLRGSLAPDYRDPVTEELTTAVFEPVLVH